MLEGIPDTWPPSDEPVQHAVVPLFPLANVWLFPGAILPLHIFEPRYREMIEDSLDGPGRLVLGTVMEGHEEQVSGAPPVYPVAGLGEIGRHDRLPDGRFVIILVGLARVRLNEIESDRTYRKVEIEPVLETHADSSVDPDLRGQLSDAIRKRIQEEIELPKKVPLGHLVDLLTLRMRLPHSRLQEIYQETDVGRRAQLALVEHQVRPLPE